MANLPKNRKHSIPAKLFTELAGAELLSAPPGSGTLADYFNPLPGIQEPGKKPRNVPCSYISTTVHQPAAVDQGTKAGQLQTPPPDPKTTQENLKRRGKAKAFTNSYVQLLAQIEDSPLNYSYNSTLYCSAELIQEGDKITTRYCNNRWCMVCNRIRIARCINGYMPELSTLDDPQFVTLTIVNVPSVNRIEMRKAPPADPAAAGNLFPWEPAGGSAGEPADVPHVINSLSEAISGMVDVWRRIYLTEKKAGRPMRGIRKLECTYNPITDEYHPHFHIIIDGRAAAVNLVQRWLKMNPTAKIDGQDIRPADAGSMRELFKYFTKIVTPSRDPAGNREPGNAGVIYVPALDQIFRAMRNRQVFRPFGIKKKVSEKIEDLTAQLSDETINVYQNTIAGIKEEMQKDGAEYKEAIEAQKSWLWNQAAADWINTVYWEKKGANGETEYKSYTMALTGNRPADWVEALIRSAVF